MNVRPKKVIRTIAYGAVALAMVFLLYRWSGGTSARQQAESLRQALREQGFKTDLADFDVRADAREQALMVLDTNPYFNPDTAIESLDLLPMATNGAVPVIWQQRPVMWKVISYPLKIKQDALDTASDAILASPIQLEFDASKGSRSFVSHTASLSHLGSALNVRTLLELHEGHPDDAWTHWLAATRLATAWEPNVSFEYHLFRSDFVTYAFATTWQALQYHDWPDAKLAQLQYEWESADMFAGVPDTAAFECAQSLEDERHGAQQPLWHGVSFWKIIEENLRTPSAGYFEIKSGFEFMRFRQSGVFVDEKNLLVEMTNREMQLRQAVRSPTWAEMSALPVVKTFGPFQSQYGPAGKVVNSRRDSALGLLSQIAPAEARRRILIVAIALERYRGRHGQYPATLAALAPEFLQAVPVDFMDGKPLRYRLTDDRHFILYSVGLDGVDNGGQMQSLASPGLPFGMVEFRNPETNVDIVWPRPDTSSPQK